MTNELRTLRANEIEVRPAHTVGDKKAHLLYMDSRATTKYLDEWVGWNNWQTEFYEVNNQTVGKLGVWDSEKKMWIWKSDVGSESSIEKEKGMISDCYKRLLARFGVVELYTAPDILISDDGYGNKGYKVSEITYNEQREITHLVIVNRFGKEVFRWDKNTIQPHLANQSNKNHTVAVDDDLEWKPESSDIAKIETNKTLTPIEELTNWYHATTPSPKVDKFYSYWYNRLKTTGWKGKFDLNSLIQKHCK